MNKIICSGCYNYTAACAVLRLSELTVNTADRLQHPTCLKVFGNIFRSHYGSCTTLCNYESILYCFLYVHCCASCIYLYQWTLELLNSMLLSTWTAISNHQNLGRFALFGSFLDMLSQTKKPLPKLHSPLRTSQTADEGMHATRNLVLML